MAYSDSKFTEICSAKTIFSDDRGFFGDMFDGVKSSCPQNWIKQTFETTQSNLEKLRLLFDDPDVSAALLGNLEHVTPVYREKDAIFSHQRRLDGEKLLQQKDFSNALVLFTQAILRAPAKGKSHQ